MPGSEWRQIGNWPFEFCRSRAVTFIIETVASRGLLFIISVRLRTVDLRVIHGCCWT